MSPSGRTDFDRTGRMAVGGTDKKFNPPFRRPRIVHIPEAEHNGKVAQTAPFGRGSVRHAGLMRLDFQ